MLIALQPRQSRRKARGQRAQPPVRSHPHRSRLLPETSSATWPTSRHAITRSTIISACSRGRVEISSSAASVDMFSSAVAAVSSPARRSRSPGSPVSTTGRLAWYRIMSITRRLARVNNHARELALAAAEPFQPPGDLQPHLTGHVIRVVTGHDAEVPQQRGLVVAP